MRTACILLFAATSAQAAITGTVVSESGKPLSGATIQAFVTEDSRALRQRLLSKSPERTPTASAKSADNGAFTIDPKARLADVLISVAGKPVIGLRLPDGEDAGTILVPAHNRVVHVTAEGKPLPNAVVAIGPFTARTDAAGLAEVPEAQLAGFVVIHPDFAVEREMTFGGPNRRFEVNMSRGASLKGRVIGADGAAVEHAVIAVSGWPLAESDGSGNFVVAHAPANWRVVTATAGNRIGSATNKRAASYEIRLAPAASIQGNVRDSNSGRGVAGARIDIVPQADRENGEAVSTDDKGNFSFAPVASGAYSINGLHPGYLITPANAVLQSGAVTKSLEARPLTQVRGRVIDDEKHAAAGAMVWVGMGTPFGRPGGVMADANGDFTLRISLAQGQFQMPQSIFAAKAGFAIGTSGPLNAESAKSPIAITLPRGFPLQVKLIDKQQQPVAGASVLVTRNEAPDVAGGRYPAVCDSIFSRDCMISGADGAVTYRVSEGRYDVRVQGETVATKTVSNAAVDSHTSPLVITVDRGVEISGRVAYADGTPLPQAFVTTQGQNGINQTGARTNADGTFTLRGLAAGPVTLIANIPDQGTQSSPQDVTAPAQNVVLTVPGTGRIEGRVVDKASHAPVTDFWVLVSRRTARAIMGPQPPPIHSEDGSFTLEHLSAGPVELRVVSAGYTRAVLGDLNVEEGKTLSGVEVQLERGAKLTGHVTERGQPLAGVSVQPSRRGAGGGFDMNSTATDAEGSYTLDGLSAGENSFDFSKQGYVTKRKSVDIASGKDAQLDVELERGSALRGRVVDSAGKPVAGARIFSMAGATMINNIQATSDAEGAFQMEGLPEGRYTLNAARQGYVNGTANVTVPSNEVVTITLDTGGTLTGRVSGLSDADLLQTFVMASGPGSSARASVDPGGTFTLHGVPDGKVAVTATVIGVHPRQSAPKWIEVSNGTASPVQIDFAEGVTIAGRVTQSGAPVGGGNITFAPKGDRPANAQIGNDGTYMISGLSPGDYMVRVFSFGINYETKYTVSGNSTFDIDIHGATLRGRVVDATTSAPLADAAVWISPNANIRVSHNTFTDSEGKFVIEALPDGPIELRASRDKYVAGTQSTTITGGAAPDVEVRLQPGQETAVRVVDAETGTPLNANMSVSDGKKNAGGASAGGDGLLRVWLAPGTYRAVINARGYITKTLQLTVPSPEIRVAMSQGGSLSISSKSGAHIRITLVGMMKPARELTLPRGPAANIDLPPGRYSVEIIDTDGVTIKGSYPADIIAGQSTRLAID